MDYDEEQPVTAGILVSNKMRGVIQSTLDAVMSRREDVKELEVERDRNKKAYEDSVKRLVNRVRDEKLEFEALITLFKMSNLDIGLGPTYMLKQFNIKNTPETLVLMQDIRDVLLEEKDNE